MTERLFTMGREVDLKREMKRTLETPRLPANFMLRLMFLTFDLIYGRARSMPKLMVLEILARYPYWAWEHGSYKLISRWHCGTRPVSTERLEVALRHIQMGREAQDNEQWHMLIWADLCHQRGIKLSWFKHFLLPRQMTWVYYHLTRLMYWLNPAWSFDMNAAFESHAEHEYMLYAREHPEFEQQEVESVWFKHYPRQKSLADLIRRIGLDERDHMNHSLAELERLRQKSG